MDSLWPLKPVPELPCESKDVADVADTGLTDVVIPAPAPQSPISVPIARPQMARNQPQPPPPHQPPPPPSPQQPGNSSDSLSLMQLRRIVTEFPKIDPTLYTFKYTDTASFPEEVDEWFSYDDVEYKRLLRAQDTFQRRWKKFRDMSWIESDKAGHAAFIEREITGLRASDTQRRCKSVQTVLHVILGVWDETACGKSLKDVKSKTQASSGHLTHMKIGILLVAQAGGISVVFEVLQNTVKRLWYENFLDKPLLEEDIPIIRDELENVMTIMYLTIEAIRDDPTGLHAARRSFSEIAAPALDYFMTITAKLRWDEANEIPQTRMFLLFWKSILLVFGGSTEVEHVKDATSELKQPDRHDGKTITASPLDYHIFRQEITSKYPAYVPPPPLIPLEPDNNSILPPLHNKPPSRANGSNGIILPPIGVNSSGASILHQPVHISTPAPSPPPSPPVGGKAGKKQNYQTNQNFPFMYPPLDSTSNSAGGKGQAGLQELLVGRKWEGSDIPKSILEAGDLFAKRMRMTRSMRQLWDEREKFLKFERGWDGKDDDIDELDLETLSVKQVSVHERKTVQLNVDYGPKDDVGDDVKKKLDIIESFYKNSIPHLQSLAIVLLKAVLTNVTAMITQPMGQYQGLAPGFRSDGNARAGGGPSQSRLQDQANVPLQTTADNLDLSINEVDALRSREITVKAVSGILLSLLKWFKVSHVLKFEYLTQLLLDSNYLPLVLKLIHHQDIDRVLDRKTDRDEFSFFTFCNVNSKKIPTDSEVVALAGAEDSDDDAAPPPIKLRRDLGSLSTVEVKLPGLDFQEGQLAGKQTVPDVDELGYPTSDLPSEPITEFSWRNFFSSINFLRIMQKICKNKAHRNLLLVQYKSSNILKKSLKIPQPELRLYTLKLFKNQVPYCGRKWRQANMRIITAIYLHCRPELRDDWLAGSDIDAEVEEALPLEQALRALTHWHNVKRYPEQMGADNKILEAEVDFFIRELEKMEWVEESITDGESIAESTWDGAISG